MQTTAQIQQQYVYDVYEQIAPHFSHTRYKPWPNVTKFLKSLPPASIVADIGCGNGKYFQSSRKDSFLVGMERSSNLTSICQSVIESEKFQNVNCMTADNLDVPLRSDIFDAVISIAVVHHFSTLELRQKACLELKRLLKPETGKLLIYVWAMEQTERTFEEQDVYVPWHLQNKFVGQETVGKYEECQEKNSVILKRFYHVFKENELEDLVKSVGLTVVERYYDKSNWCVICSKSQQQ